METIYISAERIRELLQFKGCAVVMGFDGRWKCSHWLIHKAKLYRAAHSNRPC